MTHQCQVYHTSEGQMSGVVRKGQRQDIGYPRAFAFEALEDFAKNIQAILDQPGPVFVAMKVMPEIENKPIGRRQRWQTRSREQVVKDLRAELGITR